MNLLFKGWPALVILSLFSSHSFAQQTRCLTGFAASDIASGSQDAEAPVWIPAKDANGQLIVGMQERHVKVTCEAGFKDIILSFGGRDLYIQKLEAQGTEPGKPRFNFSAMLSVRPESNDALHAILMDGAKRLVSSRDRYKADMQTLRKGGYSPEQLAKMDDRIKSYDSEDKAIVRDTMQRLRQEVPEDDLERFDAYVTIFERIGSEDVIRRRR